MVLQGMVDVEVKKLETEVEGDEGGEGNRTGRWKQ